MPDIAAAAAETNDAEPVAVAALRFRPGDRGIEIGEQFGVGLAVDLGHQVLRVADLGNIAQSEIIVRRDRKRAGMATAPRHVADPVVDSENFLADENDRRTLHTRWPCVIDWHVAARDFHLRLTGMTSARTGPAASV